MALTWKERLEKKLIEIYGNKKGSALDQKYSEGFTSSYTDEYTVDTALLDIQYMEKLSSQHPLQLHFHHSPEKEHPLHLRLFQWQAPIALSDILPMLENLDLRTYNERPSKITTKAKQEIYISDFAVTYTHAPFEIDHIKNLFQEAFVSIFAGLSENDGFNKLVLAAHLSWRDIIVLRAYAKYLRQIGFRFSQSYIEKTLLNNATITKKLVNLFITYNDPHLAKADKEACTIEQSILTDLESVSSLDEDRIIRQLLALIKATVRTNYFQLDEQGEPYPYLSFKLRSKDIPELPLPLPLYEIFIYATRFEAIHLRNAKVARGGIRWSDRVEDFRTEILGLMKAQVVKNAVIVPSGAKGGFVLKTTSQLRDREALYKEVLYCYKSFINGLLAITDNIVGKSIVHPKRVVCHDDDDPYLVVAADKGTATFSDVANDIAKAHHFWLGDAFASGGSTGYDHKKMGITARGAWESIKRHFRELNLNLLTTDVTVIGIGDMSGDVFGNGMLYSKHIKLIAAFDHRHVFIDPNPDPEVSYYERIRLFSLPVSSWEDYNPKLISKGGGVFKRSAKSITLTPQIKNILAIEGDSLTPNDLIRAILKAPVDLLYNGGIGTYVKASTETNADVGDRTNDFCRVNGNELRCKVVGEGGNLGFTQLGRIEYALTGGLINTDFIDNSAGVDCSDHEVNLKILFNEEMHAKKLTLTKRDKLLASVTDEIAELVLKDNYDQALAISFSAERAQKYISLHTEYIKDLERKNIFNRQVESLPDDKKLIERKAAEQGLTRPELAVLLAYTKIYIKHQILASSLPEDPYINNIVTTAFPPTISNKYQPALTDHRLQRDIVATQLSNHIVNKMGITFVYRLQMETGASVADIIRAELVAAEIFGSNELLQLIQSLDYSVSLRTEYEMLYHIRHLINLATRWLLQNNRMKGKLDKLVEHYALRVKKLEDLIPNLMAGYTRSYLESLNKQFIKAGLPEASAKRIATYRAIYTALNIIEVATLNKFDLEKTAKLYFTSGERLNLLWFRDQIAADARQGHWNTLARLTLRDELDMAQKSVTVAIMNEDKHEPSVMKLIDHWMHHNQHALERWENTLASLRANPNIEYTMFFIAIRELISIISLIQETPELCKNY